MVTFPLAFIDSLVMPRRATRGIVRTWLPLAGTPFKNISKAFMSATGSAMPVFGGLLTGAAPDSSMAQARPASAVLPIDFMGASSKRDRALAEFAPFQRVSEVRETPPPLGCGSHDANR